jgi:hypothetical protein
MALDLKTVVIQQNNGSQIKLFDNTGDYDILENLTGWGTPNPARTDSTKLTITIEKGDIEFTEDYTGSDITNFLDPTIGITLDSTDVLGSGYETYEDGLYAIQIAITASAVIYYDNKYEYMLWEIWCAIRKLTLTMEVPIVNYLESYNIALLNALFDDILYACQYGQVTYATEIYTFLKNVVDNETVLTELFKNFRNYAT